jgi:hypothetical protein
MLRFYAGPFLAAYNNVLVSHQNVASMPLPADPRAFALAIHTLRTHLDKFAMRCEKLPVSDPYLDQIQRITQGLTTDPKDPGNIPLLYLAMDLGNGLTSELKKHLFYIVPSSHAYLMAELGGC